MTDTSNADKTPLEILREKIAVTNTNDLTELDADENSDNQNDGNDADENSEDVEEQIENDEAKIEASEKTEEELEAEKAAAKTQREKDRIQKRINKEVAARKAAESRIAELEAALAAKKADGETSLTEEDVLTKAKEIAQAELAQKSFDDTCNRLAAEGGKLKDAEGKPLGEKGFVAKLNLMTEETAPIPPVMITILGDLDNGAEVLNDLSDDVDEYERIMALHPTKMALELAKISSKLAAPKAVIKPLSKVPAPNETLGAGSRVNVTLNDKMTDAEWIAKRNADLAAKRRA